MPVVTFAEIVNANVAGFETGPRLSWDKGGAVDVDDITAIGLFHRADRFNHAQFTIRFKHSEMLTVEYVDATAIRKLHAGLTKIWKESQNVDLRVQPLELLNKDA